MMSMRYGVALVLLAAMVTGCVSQGENDKWRTLARKLEEQKVDLLDQIEQKDAQIAALRDAANRPDPEMELRLRQALEERDILKARLAEAESKILSLSKEPAKLPAQLDSALAELAELNPQLMSYDPERGMIQLKSDLTFALGSDALRAEAQRTLKLLASVLQSPAAQPYHIRIVGHTDNVPIKNQATKAKHPTNWHLSSHRAISVLEEFAKDGISPGRMYVVGRGEYVPIVANARGGAQANRRVEIYIVEPVAAMPVEPAAGPEMDGEAPGTDTMVPDSTEPIESDAPDATLK